MKILGWEIRRALVQSLPEEKQNVLGRGDVLERLIAAQQGVVAGVTPETCMQSPTVQAIVTHARTGDSGWHSSIPPALALAAALALGIEVPE